MHILMLKFHLINAIKQVDFFSAPRIHSLRRFILSFSIMGMCVCGYVCAHEKRFLWRPEEDIVSSGAEVTRGSEMP